MSPARNFSICRSIFPDNGALPLRFMLPTPAGFAAAMRRFGVSDDSKIVTYSTANPCNGRRGCEWVLRVFGFDNAAVLDGGFQKWTKEGRAVETGAAKSRPAGSLTERAAKQLMADKNDVLAAIGDGAVWTINALQAVQHAGTGGNTYGRPGRIAGSVNVPTAGLVDPATNTYLLPAQLRAQFDAVHAFDRKGHHLLRRRHRGERDRTHWSCSAIPMCASTTPRCRNGRSTRPCRWKWGRPSPASHQRAVLGTLSRVREG